MPAVAIIRIAGLLSCCWPVSSQLAPAVSGIQAITREELLHTLLDGSETGRHKCSSGLTVKDDILAELPGFEAGPAAHQHCHDPPVTSFASAKWNTRICDSAALRAA